MRDIESRSATVSWTPVEPVIVEPNGESEVVAVAKDDAMDISYEVVVGQRSTKSAREKCSYRGKECLFR